MPRLPQNFYREKFKGANLGAQKILGAKEGAKLKNLMYLTKKLDTYRKIAAPPN